MSRLIVGDFIFKLNKLEANPLLIIIFLVPDPIQHIEPYSINCMIPSFLLLLERGSLLPPLPFTGFPFPVSRFEYRISTENEQSTIGTWL